MVKSRDWMSTDFDIVDAAWSTKRALRFASALDVGYIVVRKALGRREAVYYLLELEEFQRRLEQSQATRVSSMLSALDPTPTFVRNAIREAATRAIVLRAGRPVGVVGAFAGTNVMSETAINGGGSGSGAGSGGGVGTGGGGSGSGSDGGGPLVSRTLFAELPAATVVMSPEKLTVMLTARSVTSTNAAGFDALIGAKVDVIVRAEPPLMVTGKATHTFVVQDPQPDDAHDFDIEATATGKGRIEIDANHNGMPVASLAATIDVVDALPSTVPAAVARNANVDLVNRPRIELSLFIFERGDEITFYLQSADGRYNLEDYPPVKLHTPREYFLEFFRNIEKLESEEGRKKLAVQGLNLFRTAVPEDLKKALWSLRDRVRTLQINSDEPWIPWEVCKLYGVVDDAVEEGLFFAEAFKVTRWFRKVPAVPQIRLDNIALVVSKESGLGSAEGERTYMEGLRAGRRQVTNIAASKAHVTQAMQAAVYDGWHFTGHARASGNANADQAHIELDNDERLTPAEIVGTTSNLLRTKPFVFLNACQTAQAGMSLTDVGGWAQRFIKVPADRPSAAVFVGTYWQVDDAKAFAFAKALYDGLLSAKPIGEAAHEARLAAQSKPGEPYDTSWLAYTVYADPSATLVST